MDESEAEVTTSVLPRKRNKKTQDQEPEREIPNFVSAMVKRSTNAAMNTHMKHPTREEEQHWPAINPGTIPN